jgi:hypothetical protein
MFENLGEHGYDHDDVSIATPRYLWEFQEIWLSADYRSIKTAIARKSRGFFEEHC